MKLNARFVIFAIITAMLFTVATTNDAAAKKIKLTREEAAALVTKFKTANPTVAISEALTNSQAKGYDENFYKSLVINIKNWDIQCERAADASLDAARREKARAAAAKRVELIARLCAQAAEKIAKTAAEFAAPTAAANPRAAQPAGTAAAAEPEPVKKETSISSSKKPATESEPEKYQPKTERGQRIKALILGK